MQKIYLMPLLALLLMFGCQDQSEEVIEPEDSSCTSYQLEVNVRERSIEPNYFKFEINNETFGGWCINILEPMDLGLHSVNAVSSTCATTDLLQCLFPESYENIGAINWLLNQNFDDFDAQDMQMAIWTIMLNGEIRDNIPHLSKYSGDNSEESAFYPLYLMASENKNFVPVCGENVAILLYKDCHTAPSGLKWQTSIITETVVCSDIETN